jgi:hypothetical protein
LILCFIVDKRSEGPGPGKYTIGPPEVIKPKAPAFPFGFRTPLYYKKNIPAPNTYLLPPAIGKN